MAHADRLAETARLDQGIRPLSCQTYRACPALLEARTRKNNHPFPVPWALASRNSQTVRSAWRGGQPNFLFSGPKRENERRPPGELPPQLAGVACPGMAQLLRVFSMREAPGGPSVAAFFSFPTVEVSLRRTELQQGGVLRRLAAKGRLLATKRLQKHTEQPEFFWVAELLDSKGDPVVTGRGLGAISAEKAVPNRQIKTEIAVGFRNDNRVVHPMHVWRDDEPANHPLQARRDKNIAVVEHRRGIEQNFKEQHAERWRAHSADRAKFDG